MEEKKQDKTNDNEELFLKNEEVEEIEEIELEDDLGELECQEIYEGENEERICKKCGNKIENGELFCKVCGKKVRTKENEKKLKKNFVIGIILIIIALIGGIIGLKVHKENFKKEKDEYIANATIFYTDAVTYAEEAEEVMDITLKYWRENIFDNKHGADINEAILNAYVENIEKFSKCKSNAENLEIEFNKIKTLPKGQEDDSELKDIQKAAKQLYTSFKVFNESAINPDGSYESYSEDRNKFISDFNEDGAEMSTYIIE